MLLFLCTAFTYFFYQVVLFEDRRSFVPCVVFGVLAAYTHHLGPIFLAATITAGLLCRGSADAFRMGVKATILIGVLYVPWCFILPVQAIVETSMGARRLPGFGDLTTFLDVLNPASHGFLLPHPPTTLLDANFDDKTIDAAIGTGGAAAGEPALVTGGSAIVRDTPFSTPGLELTHESAGAPPSGSGSQTRQQSE